MNLKKRLKHLAELNVRDREKKVDDTKLVSIIEAAKNNGGLFLTTSVGEARRMERQFGFPVRAYDINLEGYAGPFYFDPLAVEEILMKAYNKIDELESQVKELQTTLSDQNDLNMFTEAEAK